MTIDEAIERQKILANDNKLRIGTVDKAYSRKCKKWMEEHLQMVEWLEELKRYRDSITAYQKGGNDAIECFVDEMKEFLFGCKASQGNLVRVDVVKMQIDKLANRLKAGEYDEYASNEKV